MTIGRIILAGLVFVFIWMPSAYSLEVALPKVTVRELTTELAVPNVDAGQSVSLTVGSSRACKNTDAIRFAGRLCRD